MYVDLNYYPKKEKKDWMDQGSKFSNYQFQINNFVFDQKWKLSRETYIKQSRWILKGFLTRRKFACDSTNADRVILVGSKGYRSETLKS